MERLVIHSKHEQLEDVLSFVEAFCKSETLSDDLTSTLLLLSTEAATNAMEHGNEMDVAKKVTLEIEKSGSVVTLSVTDEGEGFESNAVADPMDEANLLRDGGRGLFLMRELASEVEYQDEGRTVVMRFDSP